MNNFIQAANYTPAKSRLIDLISVHSIQAPQKGSTAENTARYFANPKTRASAHHCFDQDSQVRCLEDNDVAWAAPGANHNGLHYELAGMAQQGRPDWTTKESLSMLQMVASQASIDIQKYRIPAVFRNAKDLLAGGKRARGITTHFEISEAFRRSDHWDPGKGFPMDLLLDLINKTSPVPFTPKEPNMNYKKIACPTGGFWLLKLDDGGVGAYDGAPFFGSLSGVATVVSELVDLAPFIQADKVRGYWIVDKAGHVYSLPLNGETPFFGGYADHPEWHGGDRTVLGIQQISGFGLGDPIRYQVIAREPGDNDYVVDTYSFPVA